MGCFSSKPKGLLFLSLGFFFPSNYICICKSFCFSHMTYHVLIFCLYRFLLLKLLLILHKRRLALLMNLHKRKLASHMNNQEGQWNMVIMNEEKVPHGMTTMAKTHGINISAHLIDDTHITLRNILFNLMICFSFDLI